MNNRQRGSEDSSHIEVSYRNQNKFRSVQPNTIVVSVRVQPQEYGASLLKNDMIRLKLTDESNAGLTILDTESKIDNT